MDELDYFERLVVAEIVDMILSRHELMGIKAYILLELDLSDEYADKLHEKISGWLNL